jgi:hypothetical protein
LDERKYMDRLVAQLRVALAESLRAIYLTGSSAVGAYVAGSSDIDVLVAADGATRAQLEDVVARCSHAALPCPARKLELVVYEVGELAAPRERPRWSLNLDTGRDEQHAGFDPAAEPGFWFVLDLAFAHRHAQALAGPPPAELIGTPGDDAVRAAFEALVEWFARNEPDGTEIARRRARHWMDTGEFASKASLDRLPP